MFPRVAKAQPWAGIGERFQRYSSQLEFSHSLYRYRFCYRRERPFRAKPHQEIDDSLFSFELSRVGSLMYSEDFRTGRTLFSKEH